MNKKRKSKTAIISLEIYPFDVMISFNETNEEFVKTLGKYDSDSGDVELVTLDKYDKKRGRTVMNEQNQTILRLNFYPVSNSDYAMLVHELFHVTDFVLCRVGVKLSRKSDEAYAYLLQYLTEKVFNLI